MFVKDLFYITPKELNALENSVGKTPKEFDGYVQNMKEWLLQQKHLPTDIDEKTIRWFVEGSKFSLTNAKESLDGYYKMRSVLPDIFENRIPNHPRMKMNIFYGVIYPLPQLTDDLCRVSVIRCMKKDNKVHEPIEFFKLATMVLDLRMKYDYFCSQRLIVDFSNLKPEDISAFTPTMLAKTLPVLQKALVERAKGFHVINAPFYVSPFINLVKTFAKPKFRDRVFFHKDIESLHKIIPTRVLPTDYGGQERSLLALQADWVKFLESENDWFVDQLKIKSNEDLRPGKSNPTDDFGIGGSFRRLNVD